jgi:hypothetical protein
MINASVQVADLLAVDERYESENSIPLVLGDRYLYAVNKVFTNIRNEVIARGYRFSNADSRLLRDYQTMPLLMLQEIIERKIIPYVDNVSILQTIIKRTPGLKLPARFIANTLHRNYLFHESCHCVAYYILQENKDFLDELCRSEKERFVMISILTESFANTVERLSSSAPCPNSHVFFFNLNSYMNYDLNSRQVLQDALEKHGIQRLFRLAFLGYMHSNLRKAKADPATVDRMLTLAWAGSPISEEERKPMDELVNNGYAIHSGFREETAPAYFRLYDCEAEFIEAGQSDFLNHPMTNELMRLISALADCALRRS